MNENLILVFGALAVLLAAEGIYYLVRYAGERERAELRRRLQTLDDQTATSLLRQRRVARSKSLERMLGPLPFVAETEALLLQTDLSWTVASMFGWGIVLAVVTVIGLLLLTRMPMIAGLGALVFFAPLLWVLNERNKRSTKLSEQMPDALEMLVRSLRAGHGLNSGFKLVATEMPVPVSVEFGRCFEEQNVGVDFRQAVQNMTERVPNNLDLRIFAVSVVIQHETGGNLVEVLEQIAATLRERFKFYGKLRALTAEGRVSAIILGALPFVTALLIAVLNRKYMEPLIYDPMGRMIVLSGLVLWVFGFFWLRLLTRIEF